MKSTKTEIKCETGQCCACQGQMCGSCGCNCGHHHPSSMAARWILGLIVVVMIFSLGMKVGEMKGWLEHEMDYPGRTWNFSRHSVMMEPAFDTAFTVSVPATPATTSRAR